MTSSPGGSNEQTLMFELKFSCRLSSHIVSELEWDSVCVCVHGRVCKHVCVYNREKVDKFGERESHRLVNDHKNL